MLQAAVAACVGAALWLAATAAQGFHFSPDSMSYAALSRGFTAGRPFTATLLWLNAQPDRLQAIWPPLYPALIAFVHAFGPTHPWSEFLISGASSTLAPAFAVLALRRGTGRCPWWAVPILAGSSTALYVGDFGWSEPVCLALLSLHYWLVGEAVHAEAGGRRAAPWLLFAQALVAGLAFLDRYAAAPFLASALLLPAALRVTFRSNAGRRGTLLLGVLATVLGAALPVLPWTIAAVTLTGHLGAPYVRVGAGIAGAEAMARSALKTAWYNTVAAQGAVRAATHAAERHLLDATGLATLGALGLSAVLRLPARAPRGGLRPAAILLLMCAADAVLYTAVLIYLRAHLYFDPIDLRLIAPAALPVILFGVALAACVPWRIVGEALLLPLGLVILWHGGHTAAAALRRPLIPASLHGPWCSSGPRGDCPLFSWLAAHTTSSDLIITNAGYTISFQLGRSVRQVAAYPYNPKPTANDFQRWSAEWLALHPTGRVMVALDADAGPIGAAGDPYGVFFQQMWAGIPTAVTAGLAASPVASGPAYRVLVLTPG